MKLVIIGGGASGLMLASILKKNNANIDILILEKLDHVGKKILLTGNARCNLSNKNINENCYNNNFGFSIANSFNVEKYFNELGLITTSDSEGRVYPYSMMASSVLNVLLESISGIEIKNNCNVIRIIKENNKYSIKTDKNETLIADYVVLATGSKCYYKDNNSYLIASMLNHSINKLRPALLPLKVSENLSSIENLRCKVKASLLCNQKVIYEDYGEVLFKKDGLSGIVIFQLSSMIARNPMNNYQIKLDLLAQYDKEYIVDYLNKYKKLTGMFPKMINQYILKNSPTNSHYDLANTIKNLTFNVLDNMDFKNAQVSSGGINVNELNKTLESKYNPNLYFAGEIIDVDGICGGYNLHFAFACANSIANDIIEKVGIKNENN